MDPAEQELGEHLRLAVEGRRAGRPEDAWRHLLAGEAICRSTGRRRDLVTVLAGMAQLHRDAGDAVSALPLFEEAVTHCQQLRDPHRLAHALRHLGEVHRELRHFDRAQQHLRDAVDRYRSQPDTAPLDLANAVRPLASCLERQGADDEARACWIEARDLYAALGLDAGVAECAAGVLRLTPRSS
ncbi:MAG: tetratricopeptide repeat protein [Acidobacteria bacterium]|nr:tetratricopeptide repeat protein [Acidobacteriota bacterium]